MRNREEIADLLTSWLVPWIRRAKHYYLNSANDCGVSYECWHCGRRSGYPTRRQDVEVDYEAGLAWCVWVYTCTKCGGEIGSYLVSGKEPRELTPDEMEGHG